MSQIYQSKYDMTDVAILHECRTTVPSGYFDKTHWYNKTDQIKLIPVLNEFDSWKHYSDDIDISKLSSLTLCMVEVKASNVFQYDV